MDKHEIKNINDSIVREALKGTETQKNMQAPLADKTMLRARYTFYVKGARAKELEQIEVIFLDAASNG